MADRSRREPGVPPLAARVAAASRGTAPVVQIQGLVKRLRGGVVAVNGLDLVIERGQVLGLAGPNGSGKSMTLKVLLGLVRPTAGRVLMFGAPVRPGARVLSRVGALVDGPGWSPTSPAWRT